jgi:hypothetical protein
MFRSDVVAYIKDDLLQSPEVEYEWVNKFCNLAIVDEEMYKKLSNYMQETDKDKKLKMYNTLKSFYEDYFKP